MKHEVLKVEKRKILGKKVKQLRRDGFIPANIYGKDVKSEALQVAQKDFEKVFKEAGTSGLVDLQFDGKTIPVLIHNLQTDYHNNILHADFYKVNLKEKVKTEVALEFVGEPKAVTDKVGLLMPIMSVVEIEALPEALPENIQVNVEPLAAVDQQITIADIKAPEGVTILNDPAQVVVKISELVSKEAAEQAAEEAAAAEEAKAEEGAEGAPVEGAEGEAKAEEAGEEAKTEEPKAETVPETPQVSEPPKD
jgi:large subunit ribosomal protein L25